MKACSLMRCDGVQQRCRADCMMRGKESMVDQRSTGRFIARRRKMLNLTQEQLAERLGVSNKTLSKWETGKCMPDYGVVERLCGELGITAGELLDGREAESVAPPSAEDGRVVDLLRRTQELERQRSQLVGLLLIALCAVMLLLSNTIGGSPLRDFISGFFVGLASTVMVVGVFVVARSFMR